MTTPLQGLRTVIHPVADLVGAKLWFTDLLGYGPYFDEPFYVGFEVAGYELGLLPDANPSDGALVYWGVPDVAAAVAGARGARRDRPHRRLRGRRRHRHRDRHHPAGLDRRLHLQPALRRELTLRA